jgi:hypothetical protein
LFIINSSNPKKKKKKKKKKERETEINFCSFPVGDGRTANLFQLPEQ